MAKPDNLKQDEFARCVNTGYLQLCLEMLTFDVI